MSILEERLNTVRRVLRESHLPTGFINYILHPDNNPAQFSYHNSLHCQTVAYNCILASKQMKMSSEQLVELVVAALLHDWNHSGGEFEDDVNIRRAENAYMQMHYRFKLMLQPRNIIRLLKATEFPHKHVETLEEKIIQDADLLQYAHGDAEDWVRRYNKEAETSFSKQDVAMWIKSQKFNTAWGKKMQNLTVSNLTSYGEL